MTTFADDIARISRLEPAGIVGVVDAVQGLTLRVVDLPAPVGALVRVESNSSGRDEKVGEVVGFAGDVAIVMLLGPTAGVRPGDRVVARESAPAAPVGASLLGRVINGLSQPIDDLGPIDAAALAPLHPPPATATRRRRIREALPTGVRAIDLMATAGKGQRLGVFAGPGVGKSTLLGCIARNTAADINVIGLVGERGREVRDFLEDSLGEEGLARSVVVVATSDESPLLRVRAALVACAVADFFRSEGADVMLMMDSITRLAQAQRQVGLAAGEPPATKGYTPSVFALLPQILERAGAIEGAGSVTGFYTVLVEGDDLTEPVSDAARGVLDGHIVLSRALAQRGHYPAIDVLDSVSRVADDVCDDARIAARRMLTRLIAARRDVEDLVQIGAYAAGSNPDADVALALSPRINELLQQGAKEREDYDAAWDRAVALAMDAGDRLASAQAQAPTAPNADARPSDQGQAA